MKIAFKPILSLASFVNVHRVATTMTVLCVGALIAPFNMFAWVVATAMIVACFLGANLPAREKDFGSEAQELGWCMRIVFISICYFLANFMSGMPLMFPGK